MKNDLKYIIKKIIIGIGIALGIIFFKPYITFAETTNIKLNLDSYNSFFTPSSSQKTYNSFISPYNSNFIYELYPSSLSSNNKYVIYKHKTDNFYYILNFFVRSNLYNVDYNKIKINYSSTTGNTEYSYYNENQNAYQIIGGLEKSFILNNSTIDLSNYTFNSSIYNKQNSTTNDYFYFTVNNSIKFHLNYNLINDFQLIDTNIGSLIINNEEQINGFPPNGYEQINLNGYQGVLVTPKNFNTMLNDSSHTEQPIPGTTHTYLDLDYYSQNCVRGVLINIQNVQNILTSDISSGSGLGASAGSINGTCFEEPTLTTLSYQYDMYSGFIPQGILIYNNQKIEPSWDSGFNSDFNPFGESFVWVNTNLYNYYLIPNLSTFNTDINYVDYDNTEKNLKIENLPTFEDLIEDTQLNQDSVNDNLNTRAKLESIFSFVKIPFTFLNNLINGTCEPLTARFPHSSTDIVLPCLSSSFAGWLGENAYKLFQLIINGLLVYKISISLIQFTTKNLDPSDARIEVLDL